MAAAKKKPSKLNNGSSPFVLVILDGWGVAPKTKANAIASARTPNYNRLWRNYGHTTLTADGKAVGLIPGQVGNSEAGHINLGAGRVVDQDTLMIGKDINTGRFFKNAAFEAAYRNIYKHKSDLHLVGMLSNGQSAHSNPDHLWALISWARHKKIKNIYLHLFTDGRDAPPHSGLKMVEALMRGLRNKEVGKKLEGEWIASITGRFYAMDRKKVWSRTEQAYNALVLGQGLKAKSPQAAITEAYNRQETDEYIPPYVIHRHGKPIAKIDDHDSVIYFNLRSDRARQLAKVFVQRKFAELNPDSFTPKQTLKNITFVAMTDFGPDLGPILTAYPSVDLRNTLPVVLRDYRQLYIAEREKYAHVTFFFNGGFADPVNGEDRVVIPSPDVEHYDQKPEMATAAITANIFEAIKTHDFICVNYAAADMIAHTGNIPATIKGVEAIDDSLGKLAAALKKAKGTLVITADHGNAEEMLNLKTGEVDTEHNPAPVPLIVAPFGRPSKLRLKTGGVLGDVAPTILKLMKIPKPKEMTGKSLV